MLLARKPRVKETIESKQAQRAGQRSGRSSLRLYTASPQLTPSSTRRAASVRCHTNTVRTHTHPCDSARQSTATSSFCTDSWGQIRARDIVQSIALWHPRLQRREHVQSAPVCCAKLEMRVTTAACPTGRMSSHLTRSLPTGTAVFSISVEVKHQSLGMETHAPHRANTERHVSISKARKRNRSRYKA